MSYARSKYGGAFGAMLMATLIGSAFAATPRVEVDKAWVRWLPGDLPAAGYATLRNTGTTTLRFIGASSPDYTSVMLHRSVSKNGVESMVMSNGVDIAPGHSFALAPGDFHLMLMQPRHAVEPGQSVTLHLEFADGTDTAAVFKVRPPTATGAD